jgi:hypothetical protein
MGGTTNSDMQLTCKHQKSGERRCEYPSLTGHISPLQRSLESPDFRCFVRLGVSQWNDLKIWIFSSYEK